MMPANINNLARLSNNFTVTSYSHIAPLLQSWLPLVLLFTNTDTNTWSHFIVCIENLSVTK